MKIGRRRGYANAKVAFWAPEARANTRSWPDAVTTLEQWRRYTCLIYIHVFLDTAYRAAQRSRTTDQRDLPRTLRPIKSWEWKSIRREPGHPWFNAPLIPNSSNCFVRTSFFCVTPRPSKSAGRYRRIRSSISSLSMGGWVLLLDKSVCTLLDYCYDYYFNIILINCVRLVRGINCRWSSLGVDYCTAVKLQGCWSCFFLVVTF